MRQNVITAVKKDIERLLDNYLCEETSHTQVTLKTVSDRAVEGSLLLWEIRVVLEILGKPWQCDALVNGIYEALQANHLTDSELSVVMMSLHVEVRSIARSYVSKRATIRYVMEETREERESVMEWSES
jgi:hypothetical protein